MTISFSANVFYGTLDKILKEETEAHCKSLSAILNAILSDEYDEEQAWNAKCEQLHHQHEILCPPIKHIVKVIPAIVANLAAMKLRRLHDSPRQAIGDTLTDVKALSIPTPPTFTMLATNANDMTSMTNGGNRNVHSRRDCFY